MLNNGTTKVYLFALENYNESIECYEKALEMDSKTDIKYSQKESVSSRIIWIFIVYLRLLTKYPPLIKGTYVIVKTCNSSG